MEYLIAMKVRNDRNGALQRRLTLNLHRSIRDLSNPFNDSNFYTLYRLTPDMALGVIDEVRQFYPRSSYSNAISTEFKFLAALHFYAHGTYQRPDGKVASVSLSQASVSRAISQTSDALNRPEVLCKWIKFPCELNERRQIVQKNYRNFNIPGVLGYVGGTHVLIKKPSVNEELFVNGKGQHTLNVQVVCDSSLLILNILAKYPGSTQDAYIWEASAVRDRMMIFGTNTPCWLLGDSNYPLEPWLLTPILNACKGSPEANYMQLHIKARNSIERCFGAFKGRFRCLQKQRPLEYAPTKAGCIINACAVLHNICVKGGLGEVQVDLDESISVESDVQNAEQTGSSDIDIQIAEQTGSSDIDVQTAEQTGSSDIDVQTAEQTGSSDIDVQTAELTGSSDIDVHQSDVQTGAQAGSSNMDVQTAEQTEFSDIDIHDLGVQVRANLINRLS